MSVTQQREWTFGNSLVTTTSYITGENLLASISNSTVGNYSYGWDANDNKSTETITGAMSGYGFGSTSYDFDDRLTAWNRTNGTMNQSWALSLVGDWNTFTVNGTGQSRTHGPAHEVTVVAGTNITHDNRGNLTADKENITYAWDFDNKLSSCTVPSGSAYGTVGTHTYQYDALDRRISKATGGSTTVFIHAGQQILAEYTSGSAPSAPLREYVYGTYVDELLTLIDRTAQGTSGAGVDERFYGHQSHQFHTVALTDSNGAVFERYAYTPYGDLTILDPPATTVRTTSSISNVIGYTGQRYDAETTLHYFRARMMHSRLGRFIGRDPLEYVDGAGLYQAYFAIRGVDPTGTLFGWGYGNYCGFSRRASCPPGTGKKPIDALDAACERHDCCLYSIWDAYKLCYCSNFFCFEIIDALDFGCKQSYPFDQQKRQECEAAARQAGTLFCLTAGMPVDLNKCSCVRGQAGGAW